jgi:hypothetical protein
MYNNSKSFKRALSKPIDSHYETARDDNRSKTSKYNRTMNVDMKFYHTAGNSVNLLPMHEKFHSIFETNEYSRLTGYNPGSNKMQKSIDKSKIKVGKNILLKSRTINQSRDAETHYPKHKSLINEYKDFGEAIRKRQKSSGVVTRK